MDVWCGEAKEEMLRYAQKMVGGFSSRADLAPRRSWSSFCAVAIDAEAAQHTADDRDGRAADQEQNSPGQRAPDVRVKEYKYTGVHQDGEEKADITPAHGVPSRQRNVHLLGYDFPEGF